MRPGALARDTVASVPATFLLLFSSPEKRRYLTQPRTPVPTVLNDFVLSSTYDFLKSLLCFVREVASSDSEEDGGIVWRETTGLPYGIMFICAYIKVHIPICRAGACSRRRSIRTANGRLSLQ